MTKWKAFFPDGIGTIKTTWAMSREDLEEFFAKHWPNIKYKVLS